MMQMSIFSGFFGLTPESGIEKHYQLLVLKQGLSSTPYLALRELHQLIEDEGQRFPLAAKILRRSKHVDDVLTEADDAQAAHQLRDQLINLLRVGWFHPSKMGL